MTKVIFFQAHPDDLEHKCGHLMHYLATQNKKEYIIKIASMTRGEFGLPGPKYDKFKGEFLAKKRTKELNNAEKIHGIPPENVDFFGYIDGFVPFNREIVQKITEYLKREKPEIIIAPEAIYTWYYHQDHVNTGKVVFYIIYNKLINFVPKLYFFTSLSPNFYFGFKKEDFKLTDQLIACHETQRWLLNHTMIPYKPFSRWHGRKLNGWKYAEPYRFVYFNRANFLKNKPSFTVRVFSHFFSGMPFFKAKYPQSIVTKLKEGTKSS